MQGRHYQYLSQISAHDLKQLMEAYGEDVWQYAFFLTKKRDLADDISQEVFIKVYKSVHEFRGTCTLKTWLLQITRNTAFSHRRKAYFRYHVLTGFAGGDKRQSSAEEIVLEQEFANELWSQVLTLSRKYREVLILNAHYQLSLEEIAELLQISVNTVKSRLHRARKTLLKLTEGEFRHA
jgi:RNA polymerase sigma-70 factor (ECF subfamily)